MLLVIAAMYMRTHLPILAVETDGLAVLHRNKGLRYRRKCCNRCGSVNPIYSHIMGHKGLKMVCVCKG